METDNELVTESGFIQDFVSIMMGGLRQLARDYKFGPCVIELRNKRRQFARLEGHARNTLGSYDGSAGVFKVKKNFRPPVLIALSNAAGSRVKVTIHIERLDPKLRERLIDQSKQ